MKGTCVNYLELIGAEIQREADPESTPPDEDMPLYRLYALLLLAKGNEVTDEDVHNAWVVWATEHQPESDKIMPFKELSLRSQRKDDPYTEAIRRVARRLNMEGSAGPN
jgi:hypothetical protein